MSIEQDSPETLARRELLRRAAWLLGGAISAPAALAILQGCSAKESAPGAALDLKILKPDQFEIVSEIAEIMIPRTQSSGARDVGVPAFIDVALAAVYDRDAQDRFIAGLTQFGGGFLQLDAAARTAKVKSALEAALAGERDPKPFILMVRELTLLGFFTSKAGINENMTYQPVPTAFHGCVPISQMRTPVYWE
jgi:glucoside 3-dehydrogenase (cytochrome c) hitch-hiker subunit